MKFYTLLSLQETYTIKLRVIYCNVHGYPKLMLEFVQALWPLKALCLMFLMLFNYTGVMGTWLTRLYILQLDILHKLV